MNDKEYEKYPKLDYNDFLWAWELNYYDGMLSCIAFYNKEPVYISCTEEPEPFLDPDQKKPIDNDDYEYIQCPRVFTVYKLSNEDYIKFSYQNLIWKKYVGFHTEFHPGTRKRPFMGMCSTEKDTWDEYMKHKEDVKIDYSSALSNPIGYITLYNADPDIAI